MPDHQFFAKVDAWRKHPMLKPRIQHYAPGFGIATIAFCAYVVAEQGMKVMSGDTKKGHH